MTFIIIVDYIELANLDLSKFNDPVTRKELANDFFKALTGTGFFTLTNHGISKEDWDQQMDVAHAVMTLSPEEKKLYEGDQIRSGHIVILAKQIPVSPEDDKRGIYCGYKIAGGPGYHRAVRTLFLNKFSCTNHPGRFLQHATE